MKEITILSGKGGTGKTSVTAALATVARRTVFCDNDVDAPDLHLILDPEIKESHKFPGGRIVNIDASICTECGICKEHCRFEAIHIKASGEYTINPFQCEGCRLCERICPEGAISSEENLTNEWYLSDTRFGNLVHAKMAPGEENSGRLVTLVRKKAKELAIDHGEQFILNDGPPGIGCAAIASVTGSNAVLIITEPTQSGLHDLQRLIELVNSFKVPAYAVINKSDINSAVAKEIEGWLTEQNIPLLAKIPFNESMVSSMVQGKTIIEYHPDSEISDIIKNIWSMISSDSDKLEIHKES